MKNLLYITANSKPENLSASKTVGRKVVNAMIEKNSNISIEELDLYAQHIPQIKYQYFEGRSCIISDDQKAKLPENEQQEVGRIVELCEQFKRADIYVLAAPMWSLSFPSPVKEYLDCVIQTGKTIAFDNNKPIGLLNDKKRDFVYVQSSGAHIPWIIRPALNKGLNYIHEIIKFIGVSSFHELLVDGTGTTEEEKQEAISKANDKIADLINDIIK